MTDQREATAYHEAGHAVAYVLNNQRFRYVTLRPKDPQLAGHVVSDCRINECRWMDESAAMFAGLITEDLYRHEGCSDRRVREVDRQTMVRVGSGFDLEMARELIREAWHYHHHDPSYRSATPIAPDWTMLDMATAAWERAVWLTVAASEAVDELANLLLRSTRAVTWRQAREVVHDCDSVAVSAADLTAMDLLRPWFLEYSWISWEPKSEIVRLASPPLAARGSDDRVGRDVRRGAAGTVGGSPCS